MNDVKPLYEYVKMFVKNNINIFHERRIKKLKELKLKKILKRKNPYLFKVKNIRTSEELIKSLLEAHLSSQEEGLFGGFLEQLAIHISKKHGGRKSSSKGIDLEFDRNGKRYIVTIKSGPNWGNSGQITDMIQSFQEAKVRLKTNNPNIEIIAVNGCCYGQDGKPYKKRDYYKLCGQEFWKFISGDSNLYKDIIEPLGYKAKEKNEEFLEAYAQVINLFTDEFNKDFLYDGKIHWEKLVEFNSSIRKKTPERINQKRNVTTRIRRRQSR